MRRTLRTVIVSAKADLFRRPSSAARVTAEASGAVSTLEEVQSLQHKSTGELPLEPEWMRDFKDNASIVRAIDESMQKFDGYLKDVSISSATPDSVSEDLFLFQKKRKKVPAVEVDAEQEHRLYVVKQIRSMWLEKMNNGAYSGESIPV